MYNVNNNDENDDREEKEYIYPVEYV